MKTLIKSLEFPADRNSNDGSQRRTIDDRNHRQCSHTNLLLHTRIGVVVRRTRGISVACVDRLRSVAEPVCVLSNYRLRRDATPKLGPPSENRPMQIESTITCPHCRHSKTEFMLTDQCLYYYQCEFCGEMLRPNFGDCCMF